MNIAVVGTGYVGLVSGTCLADLGNNVICVDIDEKKIKTLQEGGVPIYEPGLKELIEENVKAGRLSFTTDLKEAIDKSKVIFICVNTPPKESGEADLSYVENVARAIGENAKESKIVVEKSTVPVATGKKILQVLKQYNPHNLEFEVVSNPEFLREGTAVKDFLKPDRVVVGTASEKARKAMEEIYKPLGAEIIFTDIESAELIKHASNSFLATKISFINAVANICEKTGANIEEVARGMGLDKRIGSSFLKAGIGYGGFCFPKDAEAFIWIAKKHSYDFSLLKEVQKINQEQRKLFVKKIEDAVWNLKGKTIAVLGLSFKPDTDDMRFAPSVDIINSLLKDGAKVKAFDPAAVENAKKIFGDKIEYSKDAYSAAEVADALVILTEWNECKEMDLKKIKSLLKTPTIIDGRNIFSPFEMEKQGFKYICIGH